MIGREMLLILHRGRKESAGPRRFVRLENRARGIAKPHSYPLGIGETGVTYTWVALKNPCIRMGSEMPVTFANTRGPF